jgi:hypothetical protein
MGCMEDSDTACPPPLWMDIWELNFRFPGALETPLELEKVIVPVGRLERPDCSLRVGEQFMLLPSCSLSDGLITHAELLGTLSPEQFRELDEEIQFVAKVVKKCVNAPGSRASDSFNLYAMQSAKRDLVGVPLSANNDLVVVRYSSGEIVTFQFNVILGDGTPNLINPRAATEEERQVCVVAG